jgi:hypothetical protein
MLFLTRTSSGVEPCVEFFYSYIKRRCGMKNEEKFQIVQKAHEAASRGNFEEYRRLSRQLPLAPHLAKFMKKKVGSEKLLKAGFNLSEAEDEYGTDWLSK